MKVHSNSFDPSVVCVARIINVPLVNLSTKWDYFYISSSCHLPISHSALNRWLHYDSLMKNNVQNGRYSMSVEANCCIHISKLQTHFHSSQHSFHSSKFCDAKPGTQSNLFTARGKHYIFSCKGYASDSLTEVLTVLWYIMFSHVVMAARLFLNPMMWSPLLTDHAQDGSSVFFTLCRIEQT